MNLDLIFILENIIWFVIPIVLSFVASRIFKWVTRKSKTCLFVSLVLFSIASYFYINPRCAGIGIRQLICTAKIASFFNFILFFLGLIVALVLNKLMSSQRSPDK